MACLAFLRNGKAVSVAGVEGVGEEVREVKGSKRGSKNSLKGVQFLSVDYISVKLEK